MRKKATLAQFAVVAFLLLGLFLSAVPLFNSSALAYYTNMPASTVVGQQDLVSNSANQGGTRGANTLSSPRVPFVDPAGRMIVVDAGNHRVLIWNSVPSSSNVAADLVLGQADFTSGSANRGGSVAANTLNNPHGVFSDGNKLFINDRSNHRVLIWNNFPTTNGQNADVVVGQSSMTVGSTGACDMYGLDDPAEGIWVYNNKLLVSSKDDSRVLVWNSVPTSNGVAADVIIGSLTCDGNPPASQTSVTQPRGIQVDQSGRLYVVSDAYDRVMIWNSIPTTNAAPADLMIGKQSFTDDSSSTTSQSGFTLDQNGLSIAGNRIFLADRLSNRVLIFNSLPTINGAFADAVLGQSSFSVSSANGGGLIAANAFSAPVSLFAAADKLLVADTANHRILIFNNMLSTPGIGLSQVENSSDGKLRVSGSVKLGEQNKYALQTLKASVNGEGFADLTHKDGGRNDGSDSTLYEFYHEFAPWAGNGTKETWEERGYTVKLRASSFNAEDDNLFYFQPFSLTSAANSLLTFSVNKYQWSRLKDNLDSFEIRVKKDGSQEWIMYADKLPVDDTSYDANAGRVTLHLRPKQGVTTTSGKYDVKVVAKDKWGHRQETNSLQATLSGASGSAHNPFNLAVTSQWFPLQINRIAGVRTGILASFAPGSIAGSYISTTSRPTIEGVAFSGSTVAVKITDSKTGASKLFTTEAANSQWKLTPTLYSTSLVDVSVYDGAGRYNELFPLTITLSAPAPSASPKVQGAKTEATPEPKVEATPKPTPTPTSEPEKDKRCILFFCW